MRTRGPGVKIGEVWGHLTVLGNAGYEGTQRLVSCVCSCGKLKTIRASSLKNGTVSCGCMAGELIRRAHTRHGYTKSKQKARPEYTCWGITRTRFGIHRQGGVDIMSTQLSFLDHVERPRLMVPAYVPNRQERPADLPRLRESAETMEARVLAWFKDTPNRNFPPSFGHVHTPTDCAFGLGLDLTTVRPRICQLAKRTSDPRLERCKWIKRRPTRTGSEGYYRYTEGESK